jgi:phenylpropionate dioxygenase-like ring-hydroxylating dioxygenase large terminal subunit
MLPAATASLLQSLRDQIGAGQAVLGEREIHIPVERYFSPDIWRTEIATLFRGLPLIAAHASELQPGQVMAHDAYGLPLLLARDTQGAVRCFLNVCRHRGMRLVEGGAQSRSSIVCPYHGWTYETNGRLRHIPHAEAFSPDTCQGARDLTALPCAERHGLIWVVPASQASLDLPAWLDGLDAELPFYGIDRLQLFRTVEAEYPANWKLIVDAFLEPYHIRVLHRDSIYPFFADGIAAVQRFGPHIHSLVARRAAQDWASQADAPPVGTLEELRRLSTPSQVIFPNAITIFHPDYLSLITLYPAGPEALRWTHRMLIPEDKASPDWEPHWDKTFQLIERGVFQKEDIRCAIGIQQGLASGANSHLTAGRLEYAVGWFHEQVERYCGLFR